ncbi:MAG: hypothetical protein WCK34_15330, partial [Bacteroidota bacterium]
MVDKRNAEIKTQMQEKIDALKKDWDKQLETTKKAFNKYETPDGITKGMQMKAADRWSALSKKENCL